MDDPDEPTGVDACSAPTVVVADEQTDVDIDAACWGELATAVLTRFDEQGELTLSFVGRDEIAALNAEHMGKAGPTDVLSFPLDAADPHREPPILLGDVVVCPAVAAEAAPRHAGTLEDELALLTVHGVLHVLGFDHVDADDAAEMLAAERDLLSGLYWQGPAPAGFSHEVLS